MQQPMLRFSQGRHKQPPCSDTVSGRAPPDPVQAASPQPEGGRGPGPPTRTPADLGLCPVASPLTLLLRSLLVWSSCELGTLRVPALVCTGVWARRQQPHQATPSSRGEPSPAAPEK